MHFNVSVNEFNKSRISCAVAMVLSAISYAAAADDETSLSKVVVSAAKIQQSTSEAPSNVSVITSADITESTATKIGDALIGKVPSLYLKDGSVGTGSRTSGTGIISLRGAYGGRTKVLLNGVTSLQDANSANLNISAVSLSDVDRVEVVPGVSSSLYGSDAIGGVVNIITKAPTKREFAFRTGKGFDDGDRTTIEASYRDKFQNGLGVSLSYLGEDRNGYDKNDLITVSTTTCGACTTPVSGWEKTTDTAGAKKYIIGDRGAIPSDTKNISGMLYYDINQDSKIKAGITHFKTVQGYSKYNIYLNAPLPSTNLIIDGGRLASLKETSTWMPGASEKSETFYVAGYEGKIGGEYLLKLDASYVDRNYWYLSPNTTGTTFSGGAGTRTQTPNSTKDLSAQLSFPAGNSHFVLVGAALNGSELNRRVYDLSNWRNENSKTLLRDQSDGTSDTKSFYLQDQITVTPDLTIYAGARYDDWLSSGFVAKWVGGITSPVNVKEHGESAVSPRLAAVYKVNDSVSIKSSVGTAFRSPTLYDMYAADTVSGVVLIKSDYALKPEKAKAFDIGTEINYPNGSNLKIAYFYTKISDMIYSKDTPYTGPYSATIPVTVTTLRQKTNAAEGVTRGIELSGEFPIVSWLSGSASYTWTDATVTKDSTGTGMLGKQLTYVPKNMVYLGLNAKYQDWSANISTRYSGLSFTSPLNTDKEKEVYSGTSQYWITNIKLGYKISKNISASLMVNNLFDKKYYEYYLMPGRNAAVELTGSF